LQRFLVLFVFIVSINIFVVSCCDPNDYQTYEEQKKCEESWSGSNTPPLPIIANFQVTSFQIVINLNYDNYTSALHIQAHTTLKKNDGSPPIPFAVIQISSKELRLVGLNLVTPGDYVIIFSPGTFVIGGSHHSIKEVLTFIVN